MDHPRVAWPRSRGAEAITRVMPSGFRRGAGPGLPAPSRLAQALALGRTASRSRGNPSASTRIDECQDVRGAGACAVRRIFRGGIARRPSNGCKLGTAATLSAGTGRSCFRSRGEIQPFAIPPRPQLALDRVTVGERRLESGQQHRFNRRPAPGVRRGPYNWRTRRASG